MNKIFRVVFEKIKNVKFHMFNSDPNTNISLIENFTRQSHKMVKHKQICRCRRNCLSEFEYFVELALKELTKIFHYFFHIIVKNIISDNEVIKTHWKFRVLHFVHLFCLKSSVNNILWVLFTPFIIPPRGGRTDFKPRT